MPAKLKRGDNVVVIAGKDKGKRGTVRHLNTKDNRVTVEGVAMVSKHQKSRAQGQPGGIIRKEAPIDASNVMLVCQKCGKPSRAGRKVLEDGKKIRTCKKCGEQID